MNGEHSGVASHKLLTHTDNNTRQLFCVCLISRKMYAIHERSLHLLLLLKELMHARVALIRNICLGKNEAQLRIMRLRPNVCTVSSLNSNGKFDSFKKIAIEKMTKTCWLDAVHIFYMEILCESEKFSKSHLGNEFNLSTPKPPPKNR